jgi:hypothetical protein
MLWWRDAISHGGFAAVGRIATSGYAAHDQFSSWSWRTSQVFGLEPWNHMSSVSPDGCRTKIRLYLFIYLSWKKLEKMLTYKSWS